MGFKNSSKNKELGNIRLPHELMKRGEKAIAKELSKSEGIRLVSRAVLGNAASGELFVPDTNDSILYISDAGDEPRMLGTIPKAGIPQQFVRSGIPIKVRQTPSGIYEYVGLDTATASIYGEGDIGEGDQNPVSQSQLDWGTLKPYQGLVATVKGFIVGDYAIADTATADFSASPLDTSSVAINVPSTANRAIGVLVQVDPTTGVLSYKQSSEFNIAVSLSQAYAQGLLPTRDAGKLRIGYLKLSYGISQFDNASVWTCPEWFPSILPVSGDTSGSIDNAIARWNGTSGKSLQSSYVYIDDDGNFSGVNAISFNGSDYIEIDAGGAVVPTASWIRVDTNGGAASDNLDTLTWAPDITTMLFLRIDDASRAVTIRNNGGGTGNIRTIGGTSIVLDSVDKIVLLLYDNNTNLWVVVGGTSGTIGGSTGGADNTILRADGTGGLTLQNSQVRIDDSGYFALGNFVTGDSAYFNKFSIGASASKTLSSDTLTITNDKNIIVSAETGSSDNLATISHSNINWESVFLRAASGHTITVKHGTGNIFLYANADLVLDELNPLQLYYNGTNFVQPFDGGGSSGAPSTATYITQTPDAGLSAEQALSSLATGIMKVTTTTGVISSLGDPLPIANGGTNATTAANALSNLSAAKNDLSNLAGTVAASESIVSDTDNTDDLGTSAKKWRSVYANAEYLEERSAPSDPGSGDFVSYVDANGIKMAINDASVDHTLSNVYAILRDEKTTGTNGGTSSNNTWNNRNLNTESYDPFGIVSIASNQFTPIAGDYVINVWAVTGASSSNLTRLRLYNVTSAASVKEGLSTAGANGNRHSSHLTYKFTANGSDAYRIDHYTSVGLATSGLGIATGDGSAEVYLEILLWKVA